MRILVVEDDKDVGGFVVRGLKEAGHVVEHADNGRDGLFMAASESFDAIILDRMLPGGIDGLRILETLRAQKNAVPVLILSALAEVDERVRGLKAGGDDYLTKPFAFAELLARVEALARRGKGEGPVTKLKVEDLELDLLSRQVKRAGQKIDLQPREFRLLEYLMRHAGQVVTRTMLLEGVWDYHFDPQTNVIDVHVSRLRQKVDKPFPDAADPHRAQRRLHAARRGRLNDQHNLLPLPLRDWAGLRGRRVPGHEATVRPSRRPLPPTPSLKGRGESLQTRPYPVADRKPAPRPAPPPTAEAAGPTNAAPIGRAPDLLHSAGFRFAMVYAGLLAVSAAALAFFLWWATAGLLDRQTEAAIRADAQGLSERWDEGGLPALVADHPRTAGGERRRRRDLSAGRSGDAAARRQSARLAGSGGAAERAVRAGGEPRRARKPLRRCSATTCRAATTC